MLILAHANNYWQEILWKRIRPFFSLWTPCTSFLFCFVHFKCYCFWLYWIKTKPYFAKKTKPFVTNFFFFHGNLIYVCFKKVSCAVCGETWVLVWDYISHICWHLLFCFANLHWSYQGHIPHIKKSCQSLYIQVQSSHLILKYQNNTQVFMTNPCFLGMGLNVAWHVNSFLKKTRICQKKLCAVLSV